MKEIRLLTLNIKNFKGIRSFTLETDGKNVRVFGDNATGKTTLFDAFIWLLFDKDSQNKKDFAIKTLDKNGSPIHNLNHEVEGVFLVDGTKLTLKKVFSEKWTKKRGSAQAEFTGHTSDYFVDGVPVKKKDYEAKIKEIVDEDIFKLLTSPSYFNEQLHWQDRRKILLEVCGDISDEEVIASDEKLYQLPAILKGRSIEDHRKVIAAQRAEINKELEKIPVRIDEAERSKPDVGGLDEAEMQTQIDELKIKIEGKQEELHRVQSGGEIATKEKRLREIEGELLEIENRLQSRTLEKMASKRREVSILKGNIEDIDRQARNKNRTIERNLQVIAKQEEEVERLRQQWHQVNNEQLADEGVDENCPTCGQALPEDQVEVARQKALADFNRRKAERLEEITEKGKEASKEVKRLKQENESLKAEIQSLQQQLQEKEAKLSAAETEQKNLEVSVSVEADPEYAGKKEEAEAVRLEILNLRQSNLGTVDKIRMEIATLRNELEGLEQKKARFAQIRKLDHRIAELQQQEKELAAEYEQLEQELFLTEEFIRTKVNLLEEKINSKFHMARFKLFEQQINGGLQEVCETIYEGVPYGSGLNNASRINVGLDIINTLSEHYGLKAPIFIDNAESITKLIDVDSQVISLVVSEKDKKLRVENQDKELKETS